MPSTPMASDATELAGFDDPPARARDAPLEVGTSEGRIPAWCPECFLFFRSFLYVVASRI